MGEPAKKTSISVPEMGRILGLCKPEAYWLIKKGYFEVIMVGGKMRVKVDSFEKWYANQCWYKKVNGDPPGRDLRKKSYSIDDLGAMLGLAEATVYDLVSKGHFEVINNIHGKRRITKVSFDKWYASQSDYRTVDDQARDATIVSGTYSLPEIGKMLGVHRNTVYYLVSKNCFEIIKIGRQKRVPKNSFAMWYQSQKRYKLIGDYSTERI